MIDNSLREYLSNMIDHETEGERQFKTEKGRWPGLAEARTIKKEAEKKQFPDKSQMEDSGVTYSNYMTGPGIKKPTGMAMMGQEPREETEEEFLLKNGAQEIIGHDPHRSAWERTVKNWNGWFDILGGDAAPDNPKFRQTYGKAFDEEFKANLLEETAKRQTGLKRLQDLSTRWRQDHGTLTEGGTMIPKEGGNLLQTMGVKALPGPKDPMDYRNGVPDAAMATHKQQEKEKYNAYKEAMKAEKDQEKAKTKWVSDNTTKLNTAYTELKTTVGEKIAKWKEKLKEAEKHYQAGDEGWENYIQSYRDSIERLVAFKEKIPDYLDADRSTIAAGKMPNNWPAVKKYWSNAIIKYK